MFRTLYPEFLELICEYLEPENILGLRQLSLEMRDHQFTLDFKEIVVPNETPPNEIPIRCLMERLFFLLFSGGHAAIKLAAFIHRFFQNRPLQMGHFQYSMMYFFDYGQSIKFLDLQSTPHERVRQLNYLLHAFIYGRTFQEVEIIPLEEVKNITLAPHHYYKRTLAEKIFARELAVWKNDPKYIVILSTALHELMTEANPLYQIIITGIEQVMGQRAKRELCYGVFRLDQWASKAEIAMLVDVFLDSKDRNRAGLISALRYISCKDERLRGFEMKCFIGMLRVTPQLCPDIELLDWISDKVVSSTEENRETTDRFAMFVVELIISGVYGSDLLDKFCDIICNVKGKSK